MLDKNYLIQGLNGLSRAHEGRYFNNGHLAASVIAAHYLCHENELDTAVQNAVQYRIDHDLQDEVLFAAAPEEAADIALLQHLTDTLSNSVGDLREIGHNIIFGALALKAFRDMPEAVTPFRIDGICQLIESFTTTQNVSVDDKDLMPDIADEKAVITFIFEEYLRTVALYSGYGHGWAGHLLTIGDAVIELARLGYPALAKQAQYAYQMYITTMRGGPKENARPIPDNQNTVLTPLDQKYWEQKKSVRTGLGHSFKYAYSFYHLLSQMDDPVLKRRCLAAGYKIF